MNKVNIILATHQHVNIVIVSMMIKSLSLGIYILRKILLLLLSPYFGLISNHVEMTGMVLCQPVTQYLDIISENNQAYIEEKVGPDTCRD